MSKISCIEQRYGTNLKQRITDVIDENMLQVYPSYIFFQSFSFSEIWICMKIRVCSSSFALMTQQLDTLGHKWDYTTWQIKNRLLYYVVIIMTPNKSLLSNCRFLCKFISLEIKFRKDKLDRKLFSLLIIAQSISLWIFCILSHVTRILAPSNFLQMH